MNWQPKDRLALAATADPTPLASVAVHSAAIQAAMPMFAR